MRTRTKKKVKPVPFNQAAFDVAVKIVTKKLGI